MTARPVAGVRWRHSGDKSFTNARAPCESEEVGKAMPTFIGGSVILQNIFYNHYFWASHSLCEVCYVGVRIGISS